MKLDLCNTDKNSSIRPHIQTYIHAHRNICEAPREEREGESYLNISDVSHCQPFYAFRIICHDLEIERTR